MFKSLIIFCYKSWNLTTHQYNSNVMATNNFTLQTPPLVVRPQSSMPKLKETGFRQKLKKKMRRFRRKLRRQRRQWKKAFKQIWKWQRKNRKTRSKNPRKHQKKKKNQNKNRRRNNGKKNRKNKKGKQSLVSWDAFRLKNRAWQWKLILFGHEGISLRICFEYHLWF